MPCFIVLVFTVPHRCYVFFFTKPKARLSASKRLQLALLSHMLQCSGLGSKVPYLRGIPAF